eukprot:jgi/Ulvmu1/9064/UM005_0157.1
MATAAMQTARMRKASMVQVRAAPAAARRQAVVAAAVPKKILMMGGTRFIGLYLARKLVAEGHDVTLFTRGKADVCPQIPDDTPDFYRNFSSSIKHIKGDRNDFDTLQSQLRGSGFDVVYDINGREADQVAPLLDALPDLEQYIYCSSAGVYLKSYLMPHREEDPGDPKSRHKGKLNTEDLLVDRGVNFTSVRPVYIYGPLNYNPVEEFFFHRLKAGRPVCVPNSGMQVTQLGHVKDLASAFTLCLGNPAASKQIFNISGDRFVTFDGVVKACAEGMGVAEPELIHFNPKDFDFGKKKSFPMRDQHFFASIDKAQDLLGWQPQYGLVDGLRDSYEQDFGRGTYRKEPDFEVDDQIIAAARR